MAKISATIVAFAGQGRGIDRCYRRVVLLLQGIDHG
jgi:hypothetical protein